MKSVFALYNSYFDGCDSWNTIVDLYSDHDDALMEQIRLEQDQHPDAKDAESWHITEMRVL